jgi:predicted metal-dependent enzyme (double-stranded beta helix superfamily)
MFGIFRRERDGFAALTYIRPRTALETMLAEIAAAARRPLPERDRAVAGAIGAFAGRPGLLDGRDFPCCPDRYVRHLLHSDPAAGYAVVALVWRPGQMSPVHAHRTWCAFGVHAGVLTESHYSPGDPPVPSAAKLLAPGATGHAPADPRLIHRLANLGCGTAISVHCYGVGYDRFGDGVNHVLSA